MKPLNSGYLRVLKNLSVIERCPLWGGNLKKIITFVTCSLFGMSAIGRFHCNYKNTSTRKIIPYRTILITGLWLVRKINILLWVCKPGKVYILHARHTFPFVVYIFFKCKIFYFLFFKYIHSVERCISPPFLFSTLPLVDILPFFRN